MPEAKLSRIQSKRCTTSTDSGDSHFEYNLHSPVHIKTLNKHIIANINNKMRPHRMSLYHTYSFVSAPRKYYKKLIRNKKEIIPNFNKLFH